MRFSQHERTATKKSLDQLFSFRGWSMLYCGKEKIHSERVNYALTLMVHFDQYYESCTVGVTSEVGLTTDRRPSELSVSASLSASACLRDTASFILPRYQKSHGTSHYTTANFGYKLFTTSNTANVHTWDRSKTSSCIEEEDPFSIYIWVVPKIVLSSLLFWDDSGIMD